MKHLDLGDSLSFEIEDGLATLTLNDPSTLNAISHETIEGILRALNAVSEPDSGVRALLITGEGRAFSSGLNLRKRRDESDLPVSGIDTHFNPMIRRFRTVPVPIVAAINGPAVGVGATIALVCDSIVAAQSAYFYFPFVWQLGVTGDAGISWILPRMVGWPRARRMLLQSERVPAADAHEWGLVDAVWDDAEFREKAREHALRLTTGPTIALGFVRKSLWAGQDNTFEDQLRWEVDNAIPLMQTEDSQEAFAAFVERRQPEFKGR